SKELHIGGRIAFDPPSVTLAQPLVPSGRPVLHGQEFTTVDGSIKPDLDTVSLVASCTKAFTTAACAILVDEGESSWTEPVRIWIPALKTKHDPEIGNRATLVDVSSHRTGLDPLEHLVAGFLEEFFHGDHEAVSIAANLPVAHDLRSRFLYNNNLFGVVGLAISLLRPNFWHTSTRAYL
ncbi:MAG: hypothetical protein LQ349_008562, partial [Xanthoria aureola]